MSGLLEDLEGHDLYCGRMISASKTTYCDNNPNNMVFFNACIFDRNLDQIWWGDIDLTKSQEKLAEIAAKRKEVFYVTREHSYRWNGLDKKIARKSQRYGSYSKYEEKTPVKFPEVICFDGRKTYGLASKINRFLP